MRFKILPAGLAASSMLFLSAVLPAGVFAAPSGGQADVDHFQFTANGFGDPSGGWTIPTTQANCRMVSVSADGDLFPEGLGADVETGTNCTIGGNGTGNISSPFGCVSGTLAGTIVITEEGSDSYIAVVQITVTANPNNGTATWTMTGQATEREPGENNPEFAAVSGSGALIPQSGDCSSWTMGGVINTTA